MPHQSALPAIWTAIFTALDVASITTTLGCGVYDQVPQPPTFPYLRVSAPTETRQDTFGKAGKDCTIQVHIFTASDGYEGGPRAQAILSQVIALLHYVAFSVSGHDLLACQYEQGIDAGDDDVNAQLVKHYVATFRIQVMET